MKRIILVAALFAFAIPASAADKWTRVQSRNFTLAGSASENQIREVAQNLEVFRTAFSKFFNLKEGSSVATTVIVAEKIRKSQLQHKVFTATWRLPILHRRRLFRLCVSRCFECVTGRACSVYARELGNSINYAFTWRRLGFRSSGIPTIRYCVPGRVATNSYSFSPSDCRSSIPFMEQYVRSLP